MSLGNRVGYQTKRQNDNYLSFFSFAFSTKCVIIHALVFSFLFVYKLIFCSCCKLIKQVYQNEFFTHKCLFKLYIHNFYHIALPRIVSAAVCSKVLTLIPIIKFLVCRYMLGVSFSRASAPLPFARAINKFLFAGTF